MERSGARPFCVHDLLLSRKFCFVFSCFESPRYVVFHFWLELNVDNMNVLDLSKIWLCNFLVRNRLQFHIFVIFSDAGKREVFCSCKATFMGLKIRCGLHHVGVILVLSQQNLKVSDICVTDLNISLFVLAMNLLC